MLNVKALFCRSPAFAFQAIDAAKIEFVSQPRTKRLDVFVSRWPVLSFARAVRINEGNGTTLGHSLRLLWLEVAQATELVFRCRAMTHGRNIALLASEANEVQPSLRHSIRQ